jgi:competence protein ComEA
MYVPFSFARFAIVATIAFASPLFAAEKASSPTTPVPASERAKVDINTADIPTLEAIPEIGTNFANAVVASRPFKSVDDLDRVLKLGPEKMSRLREKVTASPIKPVSPPPETGEAKPAVMKTSKSPPVNEGKAVDRKEVSERYDSTVGPESAPKP